MNQHLKGFIYIIIATCAFGTMPVISRIAILHGGNSTSILLARFIIVSIFFAIYMRVRGITWKVGKKNFYGLVILGFFIYGNVAMLFFLAMQYISPAIGEMLLYTYPAMVTIGACFFLKENFSKIKAFSLTISLGGCALVLWAPVVKLDYRGVILALLTALFYTIYIIGNRKILDSVHPVVATAYMGVCCSFYFLIVGLLRHEIDFHFNLVCFIIVLIFAFWCTITGILCFFHGMLLLGATKAAITSTFEPVFTVVLSYIMLQDRITFVQIIGGIAILCSVLLLSWPENKKLPDQSPAT